MPDPRALKVCEEEADSLAFRAGFEQIDQEQLDKWYGAWAVRADAAIGGLYGLPPHGLRGPTPRFVQKPAMPANAAGPKLESLHGALRCLVALGRAYLQHRRTGIPTDGLALRPTHWSSDRRIGITTDGLSLRPTDWSTNRLATKVWVRAQRVTPKPAQPGWSAYRTLVRNWPRASEKAIRLQLDEWGIEVNKAVEEEVKARQRRWDAWVSQAFAEDAEARVYRFIKGPQVPAAVLLGTSSEPVCRTLQEMAQVKAAPWVQLWNPSDIHERFD